MTTGETAIVVDICIVFVAVITFIAAFCSHLFKELEKKIDSLKQEKSQPKDCEINEKNSDNSN